MPLCSTEMSPRSRSNSSAASVRIASEQVISASARWASHHSTECTCWLTTLDSQPACRPASVACRVTTSGTSSWSASPIAACATSQSCACTTSGRQSASQRGVARTMPWFMPSVQATRSRSNSRCGGSSATRNTRTPSTSSSSVGWVPASEPAGWRDSTRTSCPAAASRRASAWTCRPRPPTTTGGYSQDTMSTRIGGNLPAVLHGIVGSVRRIGQPPGVQLAEYTVLTVVCANRGPCLGQAAGGEQFGDLGDPLGVPPGPGPRVVGGRILAHHERPVAGQREQGLAGQPIPDPVPAQPARLQAGLGEQPPLYLSAQLHQVGHQLAVPDPPVLPGTPGRGGQLHRSGQQPGFQRAAQRAHLDARLGQPA